MKDFAERLSEARAALQKGEIATVAYLLGVTEEEVEAVCGEG